MNSDGDRIENHLRILRVIMSRDEVGFHEALEGAGPVIPDVDRDAVTRLYEEQSSTTIEVLEPRVLAESAGPLQWFRNYDPSKGYYWRRQRDYLSYTLRRKDYELDSLDISSNKVLSYIEDPKAPEPFAVRGLVVGYIQSGKTQNFSALIAKAADAGYKIVIVLSGLHNTLRMQTQKRLERDLGRENVAGVGEPEAGKRWQWMTGSQMWGDFNPGEINAAVLQGNTHVIFVVKKNKTRLERLIEWMSDRVPPHVGVLVIDDEADQASVNTGGNRAARDEVDLVEGADYDGAELTEEELDPSVINANIRRLLGKFKRCSYVAYTATPFANVLIDPGAHDNEVGDDLFPRNFIISLPPPPGDLYVGAEQLFGRGRLPGDGESESRDGLNVVEFIPDHEIDMLVPPPRQRAGFVPTIPQSLRNALRDYVIASGAWLHRSGEDEPCTMLIHTDMQRAMQDPLGPEVRAELSYIRQQWLYKASEYRPEMRRRWDENFRPLTASFDVARDMPFESIEPYIDRFLRDVPEVRILNQNWPDTADFEEEPYLKAVLIGGNKLSRGLTIEGLLVSYYCRETLYYDTLMQMGRWFGFRGKYVDLTRLYSTELLVSCFHDLATAEEDLRRQIARYDRDHLSPARFVPKVRTHPLMEITQRSKMRAADRVTITFAGELRQTFKFPKKVTAELRAQLQNNLDATRRLLGSLGAPDYTSGNKPYWVSVPASEVISFLRTFQAGENDDPEILVQYIDRQLEHGELTSWIVLLSCGSQLRGSDPAWSEDLAVSDMPRVPLINRSRMVNNPISLGVITEPDDEMIGLDKDDVAEARRQAVVDGVNQADAVRSLRSPTEGLLMLYPISAASTPGRNAKSRIDLFENADGVPTVIAYGISFPASDSDATVEYVSAQPEGETL